MISDYDDSAAGEFANEFKLARESRVESVFHIALALVAMVVVAIGVVSFGAVRRCWWQL